MDKQYLLSYNYLYKPLSLDNFFLFQIGRIICNEQTYYANHYHDSWYELTIITAGEGTIYTNNSPVPVKKGDIYLSCLHDIHAIKSSTANPLHYDFCAFYPKDTALQTALEELSAKLPSAESRLFHSNRISFLVPLAINEIQNLNKAYAPFLINTILSQLSIYTLRIFNKSHNQDSSVVTNKTVLCYQIMDFINTHLSSISSLSELEKEFHVTYSYLSKIFKETTSLRLIDFYNMQRLNVAEKMIMENKLTLDEIAEEINFSSAFALSKAFKNHYGVSPSLYRRRSQNQNSI